ncbi:toll/interleukin-1 receptor domain-containing protein [Tissierella praeacuta]|uniref:toll/interleukin-1 receptor domain-containing protein n=1 Tax=Tissierella praeacuta TaxID=43131 RepID=UPI003DA5967D
MKKVFISHAYKDKELIEEFIKSIKVLGNKVFFSSNSSSNSIPLGKNMFEVIKDEISDSDIVIAIISDNFYDSIPCQIEMGISYAYDKEIIPLIVMEKPDYRNILKGIFSTLNRASCIYNKEDVTTILSKLSSDILLINDCVDNVMKELKDISIRLDKTKPIEIKENIEDNNDNFIKNLFNTGRLNTNETIFIKYIVENRKVELETGWQTEEGVRKFQDWLKDTGHYVNGDIIEVYNNIIKYFHNMKITEGAEYTCYGNVKLYRIKQEYLNDMIEFCRNDKNELDEICNLQYIPF